MRISIDITGADERALTDAAQRLNVPADELAAAALRDLLDTMSVVCQDPLAPKDASPGSA